MEYSPLPMSESERTTIPRDLDPSLGNIALGLFLLEEESE